MPSNTKKPTGDPSCPSSMRLVKQIALLILWKVKAVNVLHESSEKIYEDAEIYISGVTGSSISGTGFSHGKRSTGQVVGSRKRQRKGGAVGVILNY